MTRDQPPLYTLLRELAKVHPGRADELVSAADTFEQAVKAFAAKEANLSTEGMLALWRETRAFYLKSYAEYKTYLRNK